MLHVWPRGALSNLAFRQLYLLARQKRENARPATKDLVLHGLCVVEIMSRRRSTDPADKITISLPRSLNNRLNKTLSFNASRSAWIAAAIKEKLNGNASVASMSDASLEMLVVAALRKAPEHSAEKQMLLTVYDFVRKPGNNL